MAVSLSTIAAKDSAGAAIAGGLQAQDKSGAGTGPFTLGQVLIDGVAGANMAQVTAANAVKVDGSAVTQPVSLTSTTITGTVAATQSGTWTVQPGNTANTTPWLAKLHDGTTAFKVAPASTAPIATDPAVIVSLSPNSAGIMGTGSQASPNSNYLSVVAAGDLAAGVTDTGNPVKIGAKATSSEPAALTTGQRANFYTDLVGKLVVLPYANPENFVNGAITTAMTGTTSTSLIPAPAAGLRNYVTQITVSNSHATVGTDLIIQDGVSGATIYTIPAAAVYGGSVITFPTPLRQPTLATALACANVTTGASTKVSASGYKGA
jgi:hypothetical protein